MNFRWVIVILAGVGLWWFFKTPEPLPVETKRLAQEIKKIEDPVTPSPAPKAEVAPKVAPLKVVEKPKLPAEPFAGPMELVHFKVEDGLAVTFGDMILGVPVSQDPITEGYNKPSSPKPWVRPDIPYMIHPDLKNPERVESAIQHVRENTVVNFVPFTGQADAIVFEPGEVNCKSYLGRVGGHQPIKLSDQCGWLEVTHEIMHALGFVHEHSRTDRDQFVEVKWDNVQDEYKSQYAMVTEDLMGPIRNFPFDFQSVMLYPPSMFAERTSEPTMISRGESPVAPSEKGLSAGDIERINKLFK